MKPVIFLCLLFSLFLCSCRFTGGKRIRGNGDLETVERKETGFDGVEVSGAIRVYLKQDSAYSVRVETDANLLDYVETFTSSNILVIRPKHNRNLRPSTSVKVYVSGPRFRQVDLSGASQVLTEGRISSSEALALGLSGASRAELDIKSPQVEVEVSGASTARVTGETRDLKVRATGASHAKCYGLMSENAEVDVTGASGAEVFASVNLKAEASGASHVRYKGNAAVTEKNESGAGSVRKE